jgi:hypothetical protein
MDESEPTPIDEGDLSEVEDDDATGKCVHPIARAGGQGADS